MHTGFLGIKEQNRWVGFRDHCDLLGGLRVCWHSMTDADYHCWRKPITLVITAPSGFLSVEWHALQNSLHITLERVFCVPSFLIPPVEVLIVQSMGPSRASEPSPAPMSSCFTKQGGRTSWETDELHPSICLLSLFMTKLYHCPAYNHSQSTSLKDYRMETSFWVFGGHWMNLLWQKNNFLIMLFSFFSIFCACFATGTERQRSRTPWQKIFTMYKDFRSDRVQGKRNSVLSHCELVHCIYCI